MSSVVISTNSIYRYVLMFSVLPYSTLVLGSKMGVTAFCNFVLVAAP